MDKLSRKRSNPEWIPELIGSVATLCTLLSTYLIQSICLKESLSPGPFTSTNQISSVSGFHSVRSGNPDLSRRRKIRLIESHSKCRYLKKCIINMYVMVSAVYVARDVMILKRANLFRGPLEGVGPEKRVFLSPETATSKASYIGFKKSEIFKAHPFQ